MTYLPDERLTPFSICESDSPNLNLQVRSDDVGHRILKRFIPSDFVAITSDCVKDRSFTKSKNLKLGNGSRTRGNLILMSIYGGPGFMPYQLYYSVRYRHRCRTDTGTNSGTNVRTGTGGTGIDVIPNLPMCPVPVSMSYRTYRSVRYQY